ncbi:MAG: choice-of-anchor D domain-containing protein, partial [Bacteroidota bacterium]|nr:choice-of-anchor D domain-containing protein [Bacteroidota bacterium]
SPVIDASAYGGAGSTVTIDFDYWWEANFYDANFGSNTVTIYANGESGSLQLSQMYSTSDFSFDNSGSFEYFYDPLTDPTLWKHVTLTVPASYATASLQIFFNADGSGVCGGSGNFGIDNFVVTGSIDQNISFAPSSLDFGTVLVGNQSQPVCVTLTNPGPQAISLNSVQITGAGSSEYEFVGNIPEAIPADGSVDLCLIFTPVAGGPQDGNLHITDNSDNLPVIDVPFIGIGSVPLIEIDPIGTKNTSTRLFKGVHTMLGDTVTQSLIVKNIGSGSLVISPNSYIDGEEEDQYMISRLPINPLLAGQSDTLSVKFFPNREGSDPSELYILSNAGNTIPPVDLLGIGTLPRVVLTPSPMFFDSVGIGQTVCQNITISNPGSDTLVILRNYLSSNDGDYLLVELSSEQSRIAPGHVANVTVCFTPKQQGLREARFTVATNIPKTFDIPQEDTSLVSVAISGTGVPFGKLSIISGVAVLDSTLVGTQICTPFTILNNGQADLIVTSAGITGAQASDFTIQGLTLPLHIPAQGSVILNVCATPDTRGLRQALLTLQATTNEQTINGNLPLGVFGEIACASPNPLALFNAEKIVKNSIATESVVVTNCGDLPAIYTATVNGDGYSIVSPVGGVTGSIVPGGTATYQVAFNPTSVGIKNGNLLVSSANVTNMNIPLTGEGACATLTAQAPVVPQTGVGSSNTFDVMVTNAGNLDWTPGNGVMTPAGIFSVVSVTPTPIPANGTGDVKIQFSPTSIGLATSELTFPNSGPCQDASVVIDLSGQGIASGVSQQVSAEGFALDQNYPNPFTNSTTFNYMIPKESIVRITLSDMSGKIVKVLVSGAISEGNHSVTFDASKLSSGTYVYSLECGSMRLSKSLVLSK